MKKIMILCGILTSLFVPGFLSLGFASERDIAIDRAIGGMIEGSRILAPEGYGKETVPEASGKALSPGMDAKVISSSREVQGGAERATAGPVAAGGNFPGGVEHVAPVVENPVQSGTGEINNPVDAGTGPTENPVQPGTGEIENPVEAGGGTETTPETGTGTTETSGGSGSAIIDVDAGVDLDSGTVDAGVGIDTTNDQLLDADVSGTTAESTATVEADIGSATDVAATDVIIEETTAVTEPLEPVSSISPEPTVVAQVDTTGETTGGTTDVGVEGDISGTGEAEDVANDPADGTSLGL